MRRLWSCALLVIAISAALIGVGSSARPAQAGVELAPEVRDVRVARRGERTRIVIDLTRKMGFRYIVLENPPRLVIDLPDIGWSVPHGARERDVGLVGGFRFGHYRRGLSRLVFDIAEPFEVVDVFELAPERSRGFRIVADVVASENGAVVAAGAEPKQHALFVPDALGTDGNAETADPQSADPQTAALVVPQRHPVPAEKPKPPAKRVIVIDPGHGGVDPGAIGHGGEFEKNVVLGIARELRRQLEATGRYEVVMTRTADTTLRLRERLEIARQSEGELFLSLHADSLVAAPNVRGPAVYTLSEDASNREAARLASKENRADILTGIDLSDQEEIVTQILIDLAQRDANNKSIHFAEGLVEEIGEVMKLSRRRRQQAGFVVLKSPDMPSALIELGYLSNATEERLLMERAHQAKLARAIVDAVDRYFTNESS